MPLNDDDLDEPLSSRKALERSDHGKQEKKEQKVKQEHGKQLKELQLQVLKQQVAPGKPEEDRKEEGIKTRTREEEARQSMDTVRSKPDPETMIKKEEQEAAAEKQAPYEKGKDQTA